jgi:hypothetical protein
MRPEAYAGLGDFNIVQGDVPGCFPTMQVNSKHYDLSRPEIYQLKLI